MFCAGEMRAELSASERATSTARRKAIYETLHPETKHGGDRKSDQVANLATCSDRFTSDTAKATGKSERAVQRDAERGEKVIPEVMEMIAGTRLDTGAYLDKIKRLPPNEQVVAARRDLAQQRAQQKPTPRPADPTEVRQRQAFSHCHLLFAGKCLNQGRRHTNREHLSPVLRITLCPIYKCLHRRADRRGYFGFDQWVIPTAD